MKIVLDARLYGTEHTGIGRYIQNLVSELEKVDKTNKYHLILAEKHFNSLNINWQKHLVKDRHYSIKEQLSIPKLLDKINPDVVHFPHFNVPIKYKKNFVVTIHDLSMHKRVGKKATTLPSYAYYLKRLGYKKVFKAAINNSSQIITPSKHVKNEILNNYNVNPEKINTIYEGISDSFSIKPSKNIMDGKKYFLYVGNLYPHKNISRLIEALVLLNENAKEKIYLVIVSGRSIFHDRLRNDIDKHKASDLVKFTGHVSDAELSSLYHHSVAFVYPSLEEGFGLPGLEAIQSKTLLLASDISVFKEVYKNNATYFNPYDFSSIMSTMKDALVLKKSARLNKIKKSQKVLKKLQLDKNGKRDYQGL